MTQLVCVIVRFDHPAAHQLINQLPKIIHVKATNSHELEWLDATLRFIGSEARTLRPGGDTVLTRLADILIVQTIRWWIEHQPALQPGWLAALRDPRIGRAITLIHREPSRPWTVGALAAEVAMSRSSFADHFTQMVGEPGNALRGPLANVHRAYDPAAGKFGYRRIGDATRLYVGSSF